MKTYNVLWLDDEFKELEPFVLEALIAGINLEGFQSYDEGFAKLEQNLGHYDAVLLDGLFFEKKDQDKRTAGLEGLTRAFTRLAELRDRRKLPYFILSGQPDFQADGSLRKVFGLHYQKGDEDDTAALFKEIKRQADLNIQTQLRHRYAPAFSVCTADGIGDNTAQLLLEVLLFLDDPTGKPDADSYLNNLRKLVEAVFHAALNHGLLPQECFNKGAINLTWSKIFLSGQEVEFPNGDKIKAQLPTFPPVLSNALSLLIELTNNGSHYQQDPQITNTQRQAAKEKLQQLRQRVNTPYLLASLTYQLLDILVWFKAILDDAGAKTALKGTWKPAHAQPVATGNLIAGKVKALLPSNLGFFISDDTLIEGSIPPKLVTTHKLMKGMRIKVTLEPQPPAGKTLCNVSYLEEIK